MTLRLAQIILPDYDNNGDTVHDAHRYLQRALAERFGGWTSLRSQGGWINEKTGQLHVEHGRVYQVACEDEPLASAALRTIAEKAGTMARQLAVFIVYPSHRVEIIDLFPATENANV